MSCCLMPCKEAYLHLLCDEMQGQYLLGLRGPAQCVNFDDGPMKVHLVPRNGGKPMVSYLNSQLLYY